MVHKCLETTTEVGITQLHNLGHTKAPIGNNTGGLGWLGHALKDKIPVNKQALDLETLN